MTNNTRALLQASRNTSSGPARITKANKRGEGPGTIIFIIVGTVAATLIALLVGILLTTSTNTTKAVLNQQSNYDLQSGNIIKGIFSIVTVSYSDSENASCLPGSQFQRPAIMTVQLRSYDTPESCSWFVNEVLFKTERKIQPDCEGSCPFQTYDRDFSIGNFDYRDTHTIKVCCDDICQQKQLDSLC